MKKKLTNLLNNNKILLFLELMFTLIIFFLIYKGALHSAKPLLVFIGLLFILNIAALLWNNKTRLEMLFIIFVIPIGLGYCFFLIPNFAPDEGVHIAKAYSVADFKLFPEKNERGESLIELPKQLQTYSAAKINNYRNLKDFIQVKTDYNDTEITKANSAAGYFFGMYLIPSIGINVGRLLHLNVYLTSYLAKLCNLIFFVIVSYFIIKIIPFGKLVMFVYLLTPMVLHQAASCSADNFINVISLFFVSYLLHLKFNDKVKTISCKQAVILCCCSLLIACCKVVYLPLCFLMLLLKNKTKSADAKIKKIIYISLILSVLMAIGSYIYNSSFLFHEQYIKMNNIDAIKQLKFVISHPKTYVVTLIHSLVHRHEFYITTFMGQYLGWLNISGAYISTLVLVVLFVIAPFLEDSKYSLTKQEKLFVNIIAILACNFVIGAMYLSWTSVYGSIIEGVQGRYFIPIIFLSLLTLVNRDKYVKFKYTNIVCFIILFLININSLYSIFIFLR